ncbi:hypothetical protein BI347_22345 [Chromobacterium sphagni]|uniref:Uncharacterized protein n=1 Tax=Chromobacterium sphagni TaxID=1903179 RepID=A0A1S1WTA7_9NEIS|nr:hypothetical protein BI347_22345 [Chromobacterium sphagni]
MHEIAPLSFILAESYFTLRILVMNGLIEGVWVYDILHNNTFSYKTRTSGNARPARDNNVSCTSGTGEILEDIIISRPCQHFSSVFFSLGKHLFVLILAYVKSEKASVAWYFVFWRPLSVGSLNRVVISRAEAVEKCDLEIFG